MNDRRLVIGIDPGKTGGVAVLYGSSVLHLDHPPLLDDGEGFDLGGMAFLLGSWSPGRGIECIARGIDATSLTVFIERVNAVHGASSGSSFNFGHGYGLWLGLCAGMMVETVLVRPAEWQKVVGRALPKRGKEHKAALVAAAKSRFPSAPWEKFGGRTANSRAENASGPADALMIALYGQRLAALSSIVRETAPTETDEETA